MTLTYPMEKNFEVIVTWDYPSKRFEYDAEEVKQMWRDKNPENKNEPTREQLEVFITGYVEHEAKYDSISPPCFYDDVEAVMW